MNQQPVKKMMVVILKQVVQDAKGSISNGDRIQFPPIIRQKRTMMWLDSPSIKSSKHVEHSITAELDNAEPSTAPENKILDALNYFSSGSECDEESGDEFEDRRDEVNSVCDEEHTDHVEDHEDGVDTLVHSSDAPEFENALSTLSSVSV